MTPDRFTYEGPEESWDFINDLRRTAKWAALAVALAFCIGLAAGYWRFA